MEGVVLFQITSPHFCAGLIIKDGKVHRTAPIIKYMKGWLHTKVISYCNKKEWNLRRSDRDNWCEDCNLDHCAEIPLSNGCIIRKALLMEYETKLVIPKEWAQEWYEVPDA